MIWLLAASGYLIVGGIVARRTFVKFIDENGRNAIQDIGTNGVRIGPPRDPFAGPFWTGAFWPVTIPGVVAMWLWQHIITRPTPAERRAAADQRIAHMRELLSAEYEPVVDQMRAEGLPVDIADTP